MRQAYEGRCPHSRKQGQVWKTDVASNIIKVNRHKGQQEEKETWIKDQGGKDVGSSLQEVTHEICQEARTQKARTEQVLM
jgi:hypothetical protein